ncbi:hypothetical protein D3C71_1162740 [compost metagenome]
MSKNIGQYHMKAFVFIKNLISKYGTAFPSISTLAKVAGCSERYMTAIVNDLGDWGYLKKVPRYNLSRQLSNGYEIIAEIEDEVIHKEPEIAVEPVPSNDVEPVHPIKDSIQDPIQEPFKALQSFKTALTKPFIKTDDDTTPSPTRVSSEYQMLFLRDAVEALGVDTAREIFPYAKPLIDTTKPVAWFNAIQQLKTFIHEAKVVGPYFKRILHNEILKHQVWNKVCEEVGNGKTDYQPFNRRTLFTEG